MINQAVNRFYQETGLVMNSFITEKNTEIVLMYHDYELKFDALIVPFIQKEKLGFIKSSLSQFKNIPLIITALVGMDTANLLRKLRINFIDTAGNVFINVPPLLINIKGNRTDVKRKLRPSAFNKERTVAFSAGALKIIFTLLCNPDLEKNTYREIAQMADSALGTVHSTIKHLEKIGYLIEQNGTKKIINKDKLLQQWLNDYPIKLQPKFFYGRFQLDNIDIIDKLDLKYYSALSGGETAAAMLTNYLRPFIHTLYIKEQFGEFILKNHLKRNINGNFFIYKKFWNFEDDNTENDLVPTILIYADLMITADNRNIETAKLIYEKEIVRYIK